MGRVYLGSRVPIPRLHTPSFVFIPVGEAMQEDDDSSSDEEIETTTKATSSSSKPVKHDIIMRPSASETDPSTGASGGAQRVPSGRTFFKSTKSKFPMYPHYEEKIRWDDYGEIIKPEEWVDTAAITNENHDDR